MTLQQLRALCALVDRGLHLSSAAATMHRSQPALTRQIQSLERYLGTDLFERRRNRIVDLTPTGREVLAVARRVLGEAEVLRRVADDASDADRGELTVATTHTQARYTLPKVVQRFTRRHPNVRLALRQGTPARCVEMVDQRLADFAICTEVDQRLPDVVQLPSYLIHRSVITPPRHPLLRSKPLTLEHIARFPIITYEAGFSARNVVDQAFVDAGLHPHVVMSAIDADVSKAYVEMGVGIAILASIAFDARRDEGLRRIDARDLFRPSILSLVLRKGTYLRRYMIEFIQDFAPALTPADIDRAVSGRLPARAIRALREPAC